jgi:hypothetical protein
MKLGATMTVDISLYQAVLGGGKQPAKIEAITIRPICKNALQQLLSGGKTEQN